MKKILTIVAAAMAFGLLASCGTTKVAGSGIKASAPRLTTGTTEILDYQGRELGGEVPQWVVDVANGNYGETVLGKVMPDLKNKKPFVTIGYGDNLDFVRQWTDLVDVETEVTSTLSRVAAKAVQATMEGQAAAKGMTADPATMEKNMNMYRASLSNVRITGLEKVAQYWILSQVVDGKKVVQQPKYSYYVVWAIDRDLFSKHIDVAMAKIDETTTEDKELKAMVNAKLKNQMGVASNDTSVTDAADVVFTTDPVLYGE